MLFQPGGSEGCFHKELRSDNDIFRIQDPESYSLYPRYEAYHGTGLKTRQPIQKSRKTQRWKRINKNRRKSGSISSYISEKTGKEGSFHEVSADHHRRETVRFRRPLCGQAAGGKTRDSFLWHKDAFSLLFYRAKARK